MKIGIIIGVVLSFICLLLVPVIPAVQFNSVKNSIVEKYSNDSDDVSINKINELLNIFKEKFSKKQGYEFDIIDFSDDIDKFELKEIKQQLKDISDDLSVSDLKQKISEDNPNSKCFPSIYLYIIIFLIKAIIKIITFVLDMISRGIGFITNTIGKIFNLITNIIELIFNVINFISLIIGKVLSFTTDTLISTINAIYNLIVNVFSIIISIISAIFKLVFNIGTLILNIFSTIIESLLQIIELIYEFIFKDRVDALKIYEI